MSLKALHIIFISCSTLLAFGVSAWAFYTYSSSRAAGDMALGILSLVGGAGLIWYGKYFLNKLKNVSYL
jgi:hypothetical protein